MNQTTNEQKLRKRKMLLLLPLLVLPFITMAFWAFGGGKGKQNNVDQQRGLNAELPDAKLPDDDAMTKMGFYDQEEQNGNKEASERTGLTGVDTMENSGNGEPALSGNNKMPYDINSPYDYNAYANGGYNRGNPMSSTSSSEEQIKQKLRQLQKQLDEAESNGNNSTLSDEGNLNNGKAPEQSPDLDKLKNMLKESGQTEESDPEIGQLQEMMNRIYDIQHPELVNERMKEKSAINRGVVFPVGLAPQIDNITLLGPQTLQRGDTSKIRSGRQLQNGFFGLEENELNTAYTDAGIAAVVQNNSTVVNGSTVKMRLLQDIYINGVRIPTGSFINGTATLSNDRIGIEIKSLLYQTNLFQVNLTAYDMDGMEGIYVPGSIKKEVIRQSGDNAIQSIGMGTLDPSIGAKATAAGIETAKNLLSRKVKLIKVFIKAGHHILLKDNHTSNN